MEIPVQMKRIALFIAAGFLAGLLCEYIFLTPRVLAQSVFPWYGDEDVVFDGNLAGTWIGEGALKSCLLNITADPTRQVRHYNVEFSNLPGGCPDFDSGTLSAGGQMLQLGQQRFFDFWDDRCDLHTILKLNADSQTLSLVPIDPELLADLIRNKVVKLQGRIEGHTTLPADVLLISSSLELRRFLRGHANDKKLFPEEDAWKFHRK